jgi:hypothetical protein
MRDSDFLRRQAERCIAIARATIDLTVAGRLRMMASDFRTKAAEWDNEEMGRYGHRPACNGSPRSEKMDDPAPTA